MVRAYLKGETMKLMEQRVATEAEMNAVIQRLCQPGGPGLKWQPNLVDSEGFPHIDIDIPTVRAERHRLAELKSDHKYQTEKINQNIQLLHAAKPSPEASNYSENGKEGSGSVDHIFTVNAAADDAAGKIPFAVVDEIAEASPAADGGLQLGDQVVKFGNVEAGENSLSRLASEVQMSQGIAISVLVVRQGIITSLFVTPRPWHGRGLMGCHFRIL